VSLIRKIWFYFPLKHFLITATTKEVVITGFPLWQSQLFNRHDTYAREVLFWQGSGFRFVRFAFARLGSAPFGSGRLGAREESSRDYMYKKIRHGRVLKWFLTPWRNL